MTDITNVAALLDAANTAQAGYDRLIPGAKHGAVESLAASHRALIAALSTTEQVLVHRMPEPGSEQPILNPSSASFQRDGHADVEVAVWTGDDGATVIQIDTTGDSDADKRVRVNVNDGTVFDRDIESGFDHGDDLHEGGE